MTTAAFTGRRIFVIKMGNMTDEEIDRVVAQADKGWSVFAITQAAIWLYNHDHSITFAKIEERLRAIGSKTTYLASMPRELLPPGYGATKLDGTPASHWIWIGLNGQNEMLAELGRVGITLADSQRNLPHCGVIVLAVP